LPPPTILTRDFTHAIIVKFDQNAPHCAACNERYRAPIEMWFIVMNAKLPKLRSDYPQTVI
jgi:hypothetical protein